MNDTTDSQAPGLREHGVRHRALTPEAIEALLAGADPQSPDNPFADDATRWRNHAAVLLALLVGLRPQELAALPIRSVGRTKDAAGGRAYCITVPAADGTQRLVPLPDRAAEALVNYERQHRGAQGHPFLLGDDGGVPVTPARLRADLDRLAARLPEPVLASLQASTGSRQIDFERLRATAAAHALVVLSAALGPQQAEPRVRALLGLGPDAQLWPAGRAD